MAKSTKKKGPQITGVMGRAGRLIRLASSMAQSEIAHRINKKLQDGSEISSRLARIQQATHLVKELGQLKGAAMKLGQMLALEARDYLPDEAVILLEQLQNKVSFMPLDQVNQILKKELGESAGLLTDISIEPIAAASIGQVHRARFDGKPVAVKIQYPGIRDSIESDMKILGTGLKGISTVIKREVEIDGLLKEFSEVFIQETDYKQEFDFAQKYQTAAKDFLEVVVPSVHSEVSSHQILTMGFMEGVTLSQWLRQNSPSVAQRERLAGIILDLYAREFCDWGLVQTDPNPGNFLYQTDGDRLVLLDFGATKSYKLEFRKQYCRLVMANYARDAKKLRALSLDMGLVDPRESEEAFLAYEALVFGVMHPMTLDDFDFSKDDYIKHMRDLTRKLVRELKFSPPPKDMIFLHRKLGGIFQILRTLGVRMKLRPYIARFEELAGT